MPPRRILPPGADRTYMELDPADADTLVISCHQGAMESLATSPYEAAVLLWLAS